MNRRPIALITGATSGIGESCAHKFAQAGYNLIVTARRSDLLASLKRKLERQGVEVLPLVFDVRDRMAAHDAIAGLPQEWAEVDVTMARRFDRTAVCCVASVAIRATLGSGLA